MSKHSVISYTYVLALILMKTYMYFREKSNQFRFITVVKTSPSAFRSATHRYLSFIIDGVMSKETNVIRTQIRSSKYGNMIIWLITESWMHLLMPLIKVREETDLTECNVTGHAISDIVRRVHLNTWYVMISTT